MKKKYFIVNIILIILFSCKYEEGPAISIRSVENRITGIYEVNEFVLNDNNVMSLFKDSCNCLIGFEHEKDSKPVVGLYPASKRDRTFGLYKISKNKKEIQTAFIQSNLTGIGPLGSLKTADWAIIKLTNKDFWIETNDSYDKYSLKLKKVFN